ncbi:hypothetical protein ACHAXR_006451 [Thalassiosira sp. AJA248-18]
MEQAKTSSPFLSATLKTEMSAVSTAIKSTQLNLLSGAFVEFLTHVFHDQSVYDVEIVGVAIFEEHLVQNNNGNGRQRALRLNSLQAGQFQYVRDEDDDDDDKSASLEDNATNAQTGLGLEHNVDEHNVLDDFNHIGNDEEGQATFDDHAIFWQEEVEVKESSSSDAYTLTFATVVSAEHTQHQSLSHGDFQAMLIHICHKFENHLIEFVTGVDDEYFADVNSVMVSGYEMTNEEKQDSGFAEKDGSTTLSTENNDSSKSNTVSIVATVVGILVFVFSAFTSVKFYRREQQLKNNRWRSQEIASTNNSAATSIKSLSVLYKKPKDIDDDDDYSFDPLSTDNGYNGKTTFDYGNANHHSFYSDNKQETISFEATGPVAFSSTTSSTLFQQSSMDENEIPNPITESTLPSQRHQQQHDRREEQTVFAPPGKVGVAIDVVDGHPVVHKVKKGSPLEGLLKSMDVVVAIDDVDTTCMTAADVTQLMVKRMNYRRKITFVRG